MWVTELCAGKTPTHERGRREGEEVGRGETLSLLVPSLTCFLPLWRSKLLIYNIPSLSEELLLTFVVKQVRYSKGISFTIH